MQVVEQAADLADEHPAARGARGQQRGRGGDGEPGQRDRDAEQRFADVKVRTAVATAPSAKIPAPSQVSRPRAVSGRRENQRLVTTSAYIASLILRRSRAPRARSCETSTASVPAGSSVS